MKPISLHNKTILITGGAGYLASCLITQLGETDCQVMRVDRPGATFLPCRGKCACRDIEADIRERDAWKSILPDTDIIYHFAAQTSVYVAENDPEADLAINVFPMLHLLETCREMKIRPFVFFSGTVTEAGLTENLPVNEDCPDRPITVYDLHKLMAENYLKHYVQKDILKGAILRLANLYGPGPQSSSADRGVLNMMIRKALRGEMLTVYGDGNYVRDYIYVDDVAQAFLQGTANMDGISGRHFVIGSGVGHTFLEAITEVKQRSEIKTGNCVPIASIEPPSHLSPIEQRNFIADSSCYRELTGWQPRWSLPEGIDATIREFMAKENITQ